MAYLINELSKIAGVSARTLRYYDEIGLMCPKYNDSGYRIYHSEDVDQLQQILFYKTLGFSLKAIKMIINAPDFHLLTALENHLEQIVTERQRLDQLIITLKKSIAEQKGAYQMKDNEKFKGFKQSLIHQNETLYGKEIRAAYGEERINQSNAQLMKMSEKTYHDTKALEQSILDNLYEAYQTKNPRSPLAQKTVEQHRKWITAWWGYYNFDAHQSLAQMYVDDERFRQYYDKKQKGLAEFLRDAIQIYVEKNK